MQAKRTIVFDLSEVLIAGLYGIENVLGKSLGISPNTILPSFFNCRLLEDLCCAKITEDDFLNRVIDTYNWDVSVGYLKTIIRNNFRRCIPGTRLILDRLQTDYEIVLLSDHVVEWVMYIKTIHPFLQNFDELFFSCDLGQTKQKPSTFKMVLDSLERSPEDCLFIDDNEQNVAIAESVGLESIHFENSDQLINQLRLKQFAL